MNSVDTGSAETAEPYPKTRFSKEWQTKRLGEFAPLAYGASLPVHERNSSGNVPVFGSNGVVDYHDSAVTDGPTIIVGRKGSFGKLHYSPGPCWPIDTTFYITGKDADLIRFTYHALSTLGLDNVNTDGAVPGLNRNTAHSKNLLVPSLPEQRAIAFVLSDIDGLMDSLDALIVKKRAVKQAAMQQLLSGRTRLPGFSGDWTEFNMSDNAVLKARIGWQGLTTEEYLKTGEFFLITGTDFVRGQIDWSNCPFVDYSRFIQDRNIQLRPSDVLLTKDGTIGKVAFVDSLPGAATLNSGIFVIRPKTDGIIAKYIYYVLTSHIFDDFLSQLQAGSTISHLYQKDFVKFTFRVPMKDEQIAIADVLTVMDAEIAALERRRDKTEAVKRGMMQELLTGRIRLVEAK